jgi:hypothetical protein
MLQDSFPVLPAFLAIGPVEHRFQSTEGAADLCDDLGVLPSCSMDMGEWGAEMTPIFNIESGMPENETPFVRL